MILSLITKGRGILDAVAPHGALTGSVLRLIGRPGPSRDNALLETPRILSLQRAKKEIRQKARVKKLALLVNHRKVLSLLKLASQLISAKGNRRIRKIRRRESSHL